METPVTCKHRNWILLIDREQKITDTLTLIRTRTAWCCTCGALKEGRKWTLPERDDEEGVRSKTPVDRICKDL